MSGTLSQSALLAALPRICLLLRIRHNTLLVLLLSHVATTCRYSFFSDQRNEVVTLQVTLQGRCRTTCKRTSNCSGDRSSNMPESLIRYFA
jgi:hypothetical protein